MANRSDASAQLRPSIPAEISRAILIESGYRCAVCGDACPLERAHIVPWRKTHEHKKEDLICLCATCHQRADLEDWGEKTLREFKAKPWVFRRFMSADSPQKTKKLEITLEVERTSYGEDDERLLLFALASFLGIDVAAVRITSIEEGSTKVILELPGDKADKLVSAFTNSADRLEGKLSRYRIASIRHQEEDLRTKLERARSFPSEELSPEEYSHLKEMLLHSTSSAYICFLAFRLAESSLNGKNYKKALFYSRIAEDRAKEAGLTHKLGVIYNQRGTILLGESFVEQALDYYKQALEKLPETAYSPALLDNIGYCYVLLGRYNEGLSHLLAALRTLIHLRVREGVYLLNVHLDLAFAYLEAGRYSHAQRHAEKALRIAEENGESNGEKNALHLLGEIANLRGDPNESGRYFQMLSDKFVDYGSYLVDFPIAEGLKFRRSLILGHLV